MIGRVFKVIRPLPTLIQNHYLSVNDIVEVVDHNPVSHVCIVRHKYGGRNIIITMDDLSNYFERHARFAYMDKIKDNRFGHEFIITAVNNSSYTIDQTSPISIPAVNLRFQDDHDYELLSQSGFQPLAGGFRLKTDPSIPDGILKFLDEQSLFGIPESVLKSKACTCGTQKVSGDVDLSFHSNWCDLKRK